MEDRYLYKAKRTDNGEWVEGFMVACDERIFIAQKPECNTSMHMLDGYWMGTYIEIDPSTICQCTGLHDKNGKEIYEGDIVKFDDEVWWSSYTSCGTEYDSCEVVNYGVVGFDEETLRYDFVKYKYNENQVEADLHENHVLEFSDFIQEHEIIGNIYENPEVLEMESGE